MATARAQYALCVGLTALSALLAAELWCNGAVAQTTTVIGDSGRPSVEVDLDAIEGAGRSLRRPSGLHHVGVPADQPIRLKPPKGMAGAPDRPLAKPAPPPARRPPIGSLAVTPPVLEQPPMQAAVPDASGGQPAVPPTSALPAARAPGAITKAARPTVPARQKPAPSKPAQMVPSPPPPVAKPLEPVFQTAKPVPPPPVPKAAPAKQAPTQVTTPAAQAPAQATTPAAPAAPRQAALPTPSAALPTGQFMQIMFAEGSSALSAKATAALGNLADQMARSDQRIQLKAIANSAGGASPSATRRLSFSRALAVRAFLIERGVRSTRIDVRTLGASEAGGPTERVDVVLLPR